MIILGIKLIHILGKITVVFCLSFGMLFSCSNSVKEEITYISLSVNGQDGDTTYASAWEIKSTGDVYLHGGFRSPNKGDFVGKISNKKLTEIYKDFSSLKAKAIQEFGSTDFKGGHYFEFEASKNGRLYQWKGQYIETPEVIHAFLENCYNDVISAKLKPCEFMYDYHTKAHLIHNKNLRDIQWKEE